MAITLSKAPLSLLFSRNAAEVEFTAPDKFTTAGAIQIRRFTHSSYPTNEDDTIKLEWTNDGTTYERTFTFKTTPDLDQYEIIKYSGSGVEAWLQIFANGLMADPNLSRDWAIDVYSADPSYGLTFTALFETDTLLTFTATGFSITATTPQAGAITDAKPEYRLSAWLHIGQSYNSTEAQMHRTGEIEVDTDPDAKVKLNLQSYLDAYIDTPETPTAVDDDYTICTVLNRPAYILFGQKWNAPYERQKQFRSPTFRVLKGGMEESVFATARDISSIEDWVSSRFLTLRTDRLIDFDGQKDWLFFYAKSSIAHCLVKIKFYRPDLPDFGTSVFSKPIVAGNTYQFPCGVADVFPGEIPNVYKYEIWLADILAPDTPITNVITFRSDADYLDIFFEYENSLGAIESWKMKGERAQLAAISKETYENALPFGAPSETRTLKSYAELVGKSLDCTTGPLNATDAIAFADFLRSRHVWIRKGFLRYPVRISGGTTTQATKNLSGDYTRTGKFVAEISLSANVSAGSVL